jgi:membrane-associated protease RseP (regulator of RpoE activity)
LTLTEGDNLANEALWYYAIGFIIIWIIAILFRKQLKIDIEGPFLLRRTKRLRGLIDRIAQRSPRFWRYFLNVGIPVSVFFMGLMVFTLVYSLGTLLEAPQVQVVLPGVDLPGQAIYVPFVYGLIGLFTVLVVHEFGHGIIARVEGIRIKSIGLALFAVIPGAFVEPDDEDTEKASKKSRLRLYAAGSVFNLTLAAIALILLNLLSLFVVAPAFQADGMEISRVVPSSPAEGILTTGMVIHSINGLSTNNASSYVKVLNNTHVGDELTFMTDKGVYKVKTSTNPNDDTQSYIGIGTVENMELKSGYPSYFETLTDWILYPLMDLFYWIFLLNFAIGTINLLPARPLDGGLILSELLDYKLSTPTVNSITNFLSIFLWTILIVSVVYGTGRGIAML